MSRNYNWCFTYNNYENTSLVDGLTCGYIAYSHEVAPSTGTRHLQGYVHFENAITHATAKRRLPGCYVVAMRGRFDQNEDYCSKAGRLIERGTCPQHNDNNGANERLRWQGYYESAVNGKLDEIHPKVRIQYYGTFKRIRQDASTTPENLSGTCGIWIYGPPGSGKTRSVCERYPEHYEKLAEKWWDGYDHQPVVFLDEFDKCHAKELGSYLKSWADFKRFRCETKGGSMLIRPSKFIVCSNHHLNELIPTGDPLYGAIARRFKFVYKEHIDQNICSLI